MIQAGGILMLLVFKFQSDYGKPNSVECSAAISTMDYVIILFIICGIFGFVHLSFKIPYNYSAMFVS